MSKHTPGPWRYSTEPQPNGCSIIAAGPLMVAMLSHSAKDPTQRETALANAILIAASTDLLEFARAYISAYQNGFDGDDHLMLLAKSLVAKATGETHG